MRKLLLLTITFFCAVLFADEIKNLTDNLQDEKSSFWDSLQKKQPEKDTERFLVLANVYFDMGHYYSARKYYKLYFQKGDDHKAKFKMALCDFYIAGGKNKITFVKSFVSDNPDNLLNKYLILEMGKYYLENKQYWDACKVLENNNPHFPYLNYFRAVAFKNLDKPSSSAYLFGLVIKNANTSKVLLKNATDLYMEEIAKLPWQRAASRTSRVIMFMPYSENKVELLLFLAGIYDKNYFYAQSNEIYYDLINTEKMYKLYKFTINNNVESKNYKKALQDIDTYLELLGESKEKKGILKIKSEIEDLTKSE